MYWRGIHDVLVPNGALRAARPNLTKMPAIFVGPAARLGQASLDQSRSFVRRRASDNETDEHKNNILRLHIDLT